MENKIEFTDELVLPVMRQFNIERDEAERRLECLSKSGILKEGNPNDPETQMMIDDFLSLDSEESAAKVLFEKCLSKCLENKEFINSYSRLKNISFAAVLAELETGNPSKKALKQFEKFAEFVRQTVFLRLEQII